MVNKVIPFYIRGNVYAYHIDIESPSVGSTVTIAEISDLHLWKCEMIGRDNLLLLADAIKAIDADVILISGDIVNDAGDLLDLAFCEKLRDTIKRFADGKLVIIEKGNHDIATYKDKKWEKVDSKLLNYALAPLPNVFFLDDIKNLYLKNNQTLAQKGYEGLTHANVNFVGFQLPWNFYFTDRESPNVFREEWLRRFDGHDEIFPDGVVNILDMHAIGNFITLNRDLGIIPGKISVALSGHQHGGMIPAGLETFIPGGRGLIAPTMEIFPDNQRGILDVNGTLVSIGNATNVRVETPAINASHLYGPSVRFIHLRPSSIKGMTKVRRDTLKFR